jgi:ATP-dependent helicase/nuclease subunit B
MSRTPAVYSIPAGVPFVDALADGILADIGEDPAALAAVTVLLPTRRACRGLRDAFLRRSGGRALLLPRLVPLGDVDEDELAFADWRDEGSGGFTVPPAISGLRRTLLLARQVLALDSAATTVDQAVRLADELARLLDQVHTQRLSFDRLAGLAPDDFAEHWQITLRFLTILTEHWPDILAAEGCVDAAMRRNQLLHAQTEAWRRHPPEAPVIAAGSTGSIPATADLLAMVAALPRGRVVLPGLDTSADAATWKALEPTHPQYGMARLLEHLKVSLGAVRQWPSRVAGTAPARAALVERAMCPAGALQSWRHGEPISAKARAGVTRVDCPTPEEEAGAIALILRHALEEPGRTAALATPDRGLARRVAGELRRWGVDIDDSAGTPLAHTPPGAFLGLSARMAADNLAPVSLLATLKHPLAAVGQPTHAFRADVRALERKALRGPRPAPGIDGLRAALPKAEPRLDGLLEALDRATREFVAILAAGAAPFEHILRAHINMAETLAATDEDAGATRLWAGEAGEAAAAFVADLGEAGAILGPMACASYPALLDALMAGAVVRPRYGRHPRLAILGLLEARLHHADVMVLGGLNEGSWPPEAHANPWMSRPMLARFGLPPPERRIGLTAHDFTQAFSAPEVFLTRASRVGGTPTVPSRWLLRLENLEGAIPSDERWLDWFRQLDTPAAPRQISPPEPRPPVAARPRQLSVTRIETWIRDPYSVFARSILDLRVLDPIDADPGAADRGTIIHAALERFMLTHPEHLPDDALEHLIAIGADVFEEKIAWPGVRAFWWPRFCRVAEWFVEYERQSRAAGIRTVATEAQGRFEFPAPAGPFQLTGRADRIDRLADGALAVIDYKTGAPPTAPQVSCGLVPQLSLEAAMLEAGMFEGVMADTVGRLAYLRLSGGRPPGKEQILKLDVAEVVAGSLDGLRRRVAVFDLEETPYRSRPRPMFASRFGDYDHLARVKEWSSGLGEDG